MKAPVGAMAVLAWTAGILLTAIFYPIVWTSLYGTWFPTGDATWQEVMASLLVGMAGIILGFLAVAFTVLGAVWASGEVYDWWLDRKYRRR